VPRLALMIEIETEGAEAEVDAAVEAYVAAATAEEPGTLVYAWARRHDDPNKLVVWELYEDEAAFEQHFKGPKMTAAREGFSAMVKGRGELVRMTPIAAKGL
jgi:quinol monooxygenase YgiN